MSERLEHTLNNRNVKHFCKNVTMASVDHPWAQVGECEWELPNPSKADPNGVAGIGADLEPSTLVAAYRRGLFPMRLGGRSGVLGWWSPDPRGVMPIRGFHASRTLQRSRTRFNITLNQDFVGVMQGCGDERRSHGWIDESFLTAYTAMHELGLAHSVEVRTESGEMVGGLYGVRIEGLFAGESMFHRATDASKVALWATCELLELGGVELFDVQWNTDHLHSLGAIDIGRDDYLRALRAAVRTS